LSLYLDEKIELNSLVATKNTVSQFPMNNLEVFKKKLHKAWSRQTSSEPKNWTSSNRALGQCAATSLVVNDIFGGEIVKVKVRNYRRETHYYNITPSGEKIDITAEEEFDVEPPIFENVVSIKPEKLRDSVSKEYFELSLKIAQSEA
jgi:hypothetical protein